MWEDEELVDALMRKLNVTRVGTWRVNCLDSGKYVNAFMTLLERNYQQVLTLFQQVAHRELGQFLQSDFFYVYVLFDFMPCLREVTDPLQLY